MTIITADEFRRAISERQWDTTSINGQIESLVCPTCSAKVIVTKPGDPYDGRQRHIDWHVTLHETIQRINQKATDAAVVAALR